MKNIKDILDQKKREFEKKNYLKSQNFGSD